MLVEKSGKKIVLLLLFVFAFMYRLILITWDTFPPGADIGLHESVIKSITNESPSLFMNYYHMGGGVSATNPGYHIFMALTTAAVGAPDYLVHAIVVSFFSAVSVLCMFLIVRHTWSEPAAFIAAFLAVFNPGDILMLGWGGYPNVVALTLIPVVFVLFLQQGRFSLKVYLTVTSLLIGALFLIHIFSAFVFGAITVFSLVVSAVLKNKTGLSKRQVVSWILPILLGALVVSPYLLMSAPLYFGSEGTITGAVSETKQALLATKLISVEFVCFSLIPVFLFFVFSKFYKQRYLTVPAVLFASWILVPAVMTQSYIVGVYLDYERFQYFLWFPVIVCIALFIQAVSSVVSQKTGYILNFVKGRSGKKTYRNASKIVYSLTVLGLLLFSVLCTPLCNRSFTR
jgi:hypothetical protein